MALPSSLDAILAHHLPRPESSPGVQVAIVSADAVIYEAANGLADAVGKPPLPPFNLGPLTTSHQANLYSASKLFAACCALRLIETGKISGPECDVRDLLPPGVRDRVPQGQCTVERLVTHTSGAPNPLPLSWVHCPGDEVDEASLLGEILRRHPFKEGRGGGPRPYAYSNVGYWILGMAVTSALGADPSDFGRCCQELLFAPGAGEGFLTLQEGELLVSDDFDPRAPMMSGHVKAWSVLSLAARLFCPPGTMGPSNAAGWVRTEPHLPDGASYGGLVGSARSIGMFLRRLLRGGRPLRGVVGDAILRPRSKRYDDLWPSRSSAPGCADLPQGGGGGRVATSQYSSVPSRGWQVSASLDQRIPTWTAS